MARIKLQLPKQFIFQTEIPLRIGDINYGGHLGNDAVLSILHEARVQFLKKYGCSELDIGGASLIMADVAIVYRAEGFYGDVLVVEVTPDDFASRGFDLFYRLTNKATQQEVAYAKTGMLGFNYESKKLCELPAEFLGKFVP